MGLSRKDKADEPPIVCNYLEDGIQNAVCHMDMFRWGLPRQKLSHFYASRKSFLSSHLANFEPGDASGNTVIAKFTRRITAIEWHPTVPYAVTAACKGGGIIHCHGRRNSWGELDFNINKVEDGIGPGGAIFSLKYNIEEPDWLYTASLDGKVSRMNLHNQTLSRFIYFDTDNFNIWFTGMDVSHQNKALLACTNKGMAHVFHLDGERSSSIKLHNHKIHHCEFNKTVPYLIATASLDHKAEVCLWDLRNLKPEQALHTLSLNKGANVATFNPTDGSRLLTNDQLDEIRVFQAPMWQETLRIKHPHRQFQHLTSIEASWHPLHDAIVIGRYPKDGSDGSVGLGKKGVPLRPVEFFDANTGDNIHRLYHPANGIVSLNQFNPTGEVLASGMGPSLVLWQASSRLDMLEGSCKDRNKRKTDTFKLPKSTEDALRGRGRKTRGLDDDDDDLEELKPAKKLKLKSSASSNSKTKTGSAATSTTRTVSIKESTATKSKSSSNGDKSKASSASKQTSASNATLKKKESVPEKSRQASSSKSEAVASGSKKAESKKETAPKSPVVNGKSKPRDKNSPTPTRNTRSKPGKAKSPEPTTKSKRKPKK